MMSTVNLPSQVPSQRTPNDNVGGKVLASCNTRQTYGGCETIRGNLTERAGVFVGQHARYRPGNRRMLGRKGGPALKETAIAISLIRTLASGHFLERVGNHGAVQRRFTGQKSRLAHMVVVREIAEDVRTACRPDQRKDRIVGNVLAAFELARTVRNLLRKPAIAGDESSGEGGEREKCFERCGVLQFFRAGPKTCLVLHHVPGEGHEESIVGIDSRLQVIRIFLRG